MATEAEIKVDFEDCWKVEGEVVVSLCLGATNMFVYFR